MAPVPSRLRSLPPACTALVLGACHPCAPQGPAAAAPPQIDVVVASPNSDSAVATERDVTIPLERAVIGQQDVRGVWSLSGAGKAVVSLALTPGADPDAARQRLVQRLGAASLPDGIKPELAAFAVPRVAFRYVVASPSLALSALRSFADGQVRPTVLAVPGVADVTTCGGRVRAIQVDVDPAIVAAFGLELGALRDALVRGGSASAGRVRAAGDVVVRGVGRYERIEDIAQLVVATRAGASVRVADVATVRDGAAPADCIALRDGGEVVEGIVRVRSGTDLDRLSAAIVAALRSVQGPPDLRVEPVGSDGPETLRLAIDIAPGTSLDARARTARELSAWLRTRGEIESVLAEIGQVDPISPDPFASALELRARLRPASTWAQGRTPTLVEAEIRSHVLALPGLEVRVAWPAALAPRAPSPPIVVAITGPELDTLETLAASARQVLAAAPGVVATRVAGADRIPRFEVHVDRAAASRHGLDLGDIALSISLVLDGVTVSEFVDSDRRYDVILRIGLGAPAIDTSVNPERLSAVVLAGPGGKVPLANVVELRWTRAPSAILRRDGQRAVLVQLDTDARPRADLLREIRTRLAASLALPIGYALQLDE